jgi:hypothetical protein
MVDLRGGAGGIGRIACRAADALPSTRGVRPTTSAERSLTAPSLGCPNRALPRPSAYLR